MNLQDLLGYIGLAIILVPVAACAALPLVSSELPDVLEQQHTRFS